jgi:hypothetical protein
MENMITWWALVGNWTPLRMSSSICQMASRLQNWNCFNGNLAMNCFAKDVPYFFDTNDSKRKVRDMSWNNYHWELVQSNCFTGNGTDTYIDIADWWPVWTNYSNWFSIAAWIKPNSVWETEWRIWDKSLWWFWFQFLVSTSNKLDPLCFEVVYGIMLS